VHFTKFSLFCMNFKTMKPEQDFVIFIFIVGDTVGQVFRHWLIITT